jgi:hypothetical protein
MDMDGVNAAPFAVQSGIFPTVELGASTKLAELVATLSAERASDLVVECRKSAEEMADADSPTASLPRSSTGYRR